MARLENIAILIYISQMQENIYLLRDQTIEAKSILKLSPNKIDQSINIMVLDHLCRTYTVIMLYPHKKRK